jgi:Cu/Zn superoxide dismutase
MWKPDHRLLLVSALAAGSVALLASIGSPARAAPLAATGNAGDRFACGVIALT